MNRVVNRRVFLMFSFFPQSRIGGRRRYRAVPMMVEPVERRMMFAATITGAIADVSVDRNASSTAIDLTGHFNDPSVTGTVTEFSFTPDVGNVFVELFD